MPFVSEEQFVSPRPHIDLDHHSREYSERGVAQLAELREKCPVGWSEAQGGFWAITRHDDVHEVLRCPEVFTSQKSQDEKGVWSGGSVIPASQRTPLLPLEMDGPLSVAYRRQVTHWANRTAADDLVPTIEVFADFLLDRVIESGRMDVISDFGNPLPALVIMSILDFDLSDWHRFSAPFHTLEAAPKDSEEFRQCQAEFGWIREQLVGYCERRRANPGEDPISSLVTAEVQGAPIPIFDCVQTLMTFIGGGVDTTTATLGHAMRYLSAHPEQRALLVAEPERITMAVEEFLRVFPPVRQLARTVVKGTEFRGHVMEPQERVLVSVLSANHDESAFERADEVDLTRTPNPHVTFGMGRHRCAGLNVARAELQVSLRKLLERLGDFEVLESEARRYDEAGNVDGWVTMPAVFPPGKRVHPDVSGLGLEAETLGL